MTESLYRRSRLLFWLALAAVLSAVVRANPLPASSSSLSRDGKDPEERTHPLSPSVAADARRHAVEQIDMEKDDASLPEATEQDDEHESNEEEEEEVDEGLVATTVAAIIMVLIVMTIGFEKAKHHIEHTADRNMKPIIESMFGELTVLGFLSIFTFCVTKMGYFAQLSTWLFGEHEEEALLEEFEFVHYFLFFIMVFFVTLVLLLVHEAKSLEKEWFAMDRACLDRAYIERLQNEWTTLSAGGQNRRSTGTLLAYFANAFFPFIVNKDKRLVRNIEEQLLFDRVRQEFVLERSTKEPFEPAPAEHRVPSDFHFGRYLSICLGQTLAHAVHVGEGTWAVFAVLTLVLYGVLQALDDNPLIFTWIWAGLGWMMFILSTAFDFHMMQIIGAHAARTPLSGTISTGQGEEVPLMPASTALPAWCSIDMDQYMAKRSWLSKCVNDRKHAVAIRPHDTLYILEHSGPRLYGGIFQVKLVFVAAYWSLLLLSFLPYTWHEGSVVEFVAYAIVSILPMSLIRFSGKHSAALLAQVSCIGVHTKPQVVAQVIREEKTARVVRAFCILQKVQQAAESGFTNPSASHGGNGHSGDEKRHGGNEHHDSEEHRDVPAFVEAQHWDPMEVAQICKTFDALDLDNDGIISTGELRDLMRRLGIRLTEENLERMIAVLDSNGDGKIDQHEFTRFYMNHVSVNHTSDEHASHSHGHDHHHELHERAHYFFDLFDKDNSGSITISEFKTTLDNFEVGFTVDEVGELVSELDVHDDGTLSLHEFLGLFERHQELIEMERSRRLL